ncbi:CDP-glycerol glycerophosphotransferase family protein [Halomonas mongoliensis]|uniref:CDP-glycerol glycerophosphotransferase family protein n=1 Tax=Halomonas mongoliensis TaxID=321265 RepID=UPI00403A8706
MLVGCLVGHDGFNLKLSIGGCVEKQIRKLARKKVVPMMLTYGFLSLAWILLEKVSFGQLLMTGLIMVFQAVVPEIRKYGQKAISVEKISSNNFGSLSLPSIYALSLTPLVAGYSLVAGLVYMVLVISFLMPSILRSFKRIVSREELVGKEKARFKEYGAPVAIYASGPAGAAYQVNQWIDVMESLEAKVVIIARERALAKNIKPSSIPVFYAKSHADLESLLVSGIKTLLYPANPIKNAQALRQININHYFINHGESDKAVNQSKFLMAYDKILVSGELAEKRIKDAGLPVREGQVVHVGRPQTDLLLDKIQSPREIKHVLYAPTWEGFGDNVNYSSIKKMGAEIVRAILSNEEFFLTFKPHPYTGMVKKEFRESLDAIVALCLSSPRAKVVGKDESIYNCMNESDVLVTDISSVLNEYLATSKPIILCNSGDHSLEALKSNFPSSAGAYILMKGKECLSLIESIKKNDEMWAKRGEIRRASLGDFPEGALHRFNEVVSDSCLK